MALHSLYCADVPLRNCSLTHSLKFLDGAVNTVHTAPWPHCSDRNVFSHRRNSPYDI